MQTDTDERTDTLADIWRDTDGHRHTGDVRKVAARYIKIRKCTFEYKEK